MPLYTTRLSDLVAEWPVVRQVAVRGRAAVVRRHSISEALHILEGARR